jgi:hypothetical protein
MIEVQFPDPDRSIFESEKEVVTGRRDIITLHNEAIRYYSRMKRWAAHFSACISREKHTKVLSGNLKGHDH